MAVAAVVQVNATCATLHQELLMIEGDALATEQGGHSIWEAQDRLRPPLVS